MRKKAALSGEKFHWLTVVREGERSPSGQVMWECVCDCGKRRLVTSQMLVSGNAKSCGCMNFKLKAHGNRRFSGNVSLLRAKAANYKAHSGLRRIAWSLTTEEACVLLSGNCKYCGSPPCSKFSHPSMPMSGELMINGIDRVDSSLGYESSNVVSCCHKCNTAKNTMSVPEFISWAKSVVNHSNENSSNK